MKRKIFVLAGLCLVMIGVGIFLREGQGDAPAGTPGIRKPRDNPAAAENDGGKARSQPASRTVSAPVADKMAADDTSTRHSRAQSTASMIVIGDKQYPRRVYTPLALPNDPLVSQWWVTTTHMDQAWQVPSGTTQTTLAIIDSGFALGHEEFAGRWYVSGGENGAATSEGPSALNCTDRNLAINASCNLIDEDNDGTVDNETGAAIYQNPSRLNCTAQGRALDKSCNRLDDDGNSYVDDAKGWDFINNDNSVQAGELNPAGENTTHGTKVAGVAAASGNNAKGMAGVDWSTKILPIQALDDDGYGDTLSVGRAIYYATQQGADVISLSLGSDLSDDFVREAVQDALSAGVVVVAASGNDGCDCMVYPANYPEVVAVGALNSSSQPASFSSFGDNLDILAPGTDITSATWQSGNQTSAYTSGNNGTSFATPMVGGMLTRLKSSRPEATPAQLLAALTESVNRSGLPPATPLDTHYGFGVLDAGRTMNRMTTPRTGQVAYAFTPVSKGNTLNPASPAEPSGTGFAYVCENGIVGTTPVYELVKGPSRFFSLSKVERQKAADIGYTSNFLTYACLSQPHDTTTVMHSLNIFREFRNMDGRPQ